MNGVERSNDGVIQRAIESAKCRIYKINYVMNGNISSLHQKKAENQKELMEVTVKALERYDAFERVIERLEERIRILDNTSDINYPSVDVAIKETERIIKIIKEELM